MNHPEITALCMMATSQLQAIEVATEKWPFTEITTTPWGILKSAEPLFEMTKNHPKLIRNGYLAIAQYPLVKFEAPKLMPNQTNWSRVTQTNYQRLVSGASKPHLN